MTTRPQTPPPQRSLSQAGAPFGLPGFRTLVDSFQLARVVVDLVARGSKRRDGLGGLGDDQIEGAQPALAFAAGKLQKSP